MKKEKNIEKIIKENPAIDKELFQNSRKAIGELRKIGVKDPQYGLESPFARTKKPLPTNLKTAYEIFKQAN